MMPCSLATLASVKYGVETKRSSVRRLPNGAYLSWDEENSESVCQVIVALTELGISLDNERFVKNGQTLPQVLERFACEDGSYRHSLNGNSDEMATEQAFYALAAIHRAETGKTTLYDMTDVMQ